MDPQNQSETSPPRNEPHCEPESSIAPAVPPPSKKKARNPPNPNAPSGRKEGVVWDHFNKETVDGVRTAYCKYCSRSYKADPQIHGTSNLHGHLSSCKKYAETLGVKGQQTLGFKPRPDGEEGVDLVSTIFKLADGRKALAEMIIIDELSFRFAEGVGFRRFMGVVQPLFTPIPSRHTIVRDINLIYDQQRIKLMKMMKGRRICLTTDTWTSIQNLCYMCLTAHFVDDNWKLQKRIINFCQVEDHKGVTIGKKIEASLLEWNIDSILTLTVDNASSNNLTIKYLQGKTKTWKGTLLGHDYLHMRCCAHILILIVGDGLKEMENSIASVRHAVRFVRSSPHRLACFNKCVKFLKIECKKGLCLDVSTRWNSTYSMLDAAEKYEAVFERLNEDDYGFKNYFADPEVSAGSLAPNATDWGKCRVFVKFLRLFYLATKRFSGTLYVTSNTFYKQIVVIDMMIKKSIAEKDTLLQDMAKSMKLKFDKYWGMGDKINLLLYVSVVLDPTKKIEYLGFCFAQNLDGDKEKIKEMLEKVKSCLTHLYNCYASLDSSNVEQVPSVSQPASMVLDVDDDEDPHSSLIDAQFNTYMEVKATSSSQTDLERYLSDNVEPAPHPHGKDEFDILNWWKTNSTKYRVVSQIARDVLAMPVSTVASESAFSTGGRILDPFRSSLSPKTVEVLVCAQNWLRSNLPISLRQSMDKIEEFECDQYQSEGGPSDSSTCSSPTIIDADA